MKPFYQGKRVLVTGGASFIGSHLTERLLGLGCKVTVADDLSSGKLSHLRSVNDQIVFLEGDLRLASFAKEASADQDMVFHLAAAHGGRGYIETHPVECMNNMLLDHVVYSEAAKSCVKKVVMASSACVYPTSLQDSYDHLYSLKEGDAGFAEQGKAFADGDYGWAKLMGEYQLKSFHKQFGISGICCRIFTAYGERENISHAVIALIVKALMRMEPFEIWGSGQQTRNFTYVEDTVTGFVRAGAKLDGYQVINIGTDVHSSVISLCHQIFEIIGWHPEEIITTPDKFEGVKNRAADCRKCKELLDWVPGISVDEGLRRTIMWLENNVDLNNSGLDDQTLVSR